ncbi:MAG TPA: alkaline phosphatase D family protein [bacterium]|nr:alkaline phosphatase D family protein [bacterium]
MIATLQELIVIARSCCPGDVIWGAVRTLALLCVLVLSPVVDIRAAVDYVWCGAVTPTTARIKAKAQAEGAVARAVYATDSALGSPVYSLPDTAADAVNHGVVELSLSGLAPSTRYFYAIEIDGAVDTLKRGEFTTMPPDGAAIFTIALGSCASTGSNHAVFQTIRGHRPLLFLHTGDFHYQNIAVNDASLFRAAYATVLAAPNQSALYRSTAIDYIWDDHDYGPNNSDSTAPGRSASRLTYQEQVPHYPLPAGGGDVPIYHTFAIGRALFIVTDSRSERSPASAVDDASKTMLGATQKAWFKQTLLDAQGVYPLKVWVNTLPWIGLTGDDGWHLYTNERREISDFIKDNRITGLCMLSGDAHMLAIDDGTNSDYATGGGAGFPVFHAAALDRTGSIKGGPYSEGAYPGAGQYGLMTVIDSGGSEIRVVWSGRTAADVQRVGHSFTVPAEPLPCDCARHGDVAGDDGVATVFDLVSLIDHVFRGAAAPVRDLVCPHLHRGDLNCDAAADVVDVVLMVQRAFRGGMELCAPCDCPPYPAICP